MYRVLDWYESIRDFLEMGGPVLLAIGLLTLVMWVLIFERLIYFRTGHRRLVREVLAMWDARPERRSWNARRIRDAMISRVSTEHRRVPAVDQDAGGSVPAAGFAGHGDGNDRGVRGDGVLGDGESAVDGGGGVPGDYPDDGGDGGGVVGAVCDDSDVALRTPRGRAAQGRIDNQEVRLCVVHFPA